MRKAPVVAKNEAATAVPARPRQTEAAQPAPRADLRHLQRVYGNRFVQRLLKQAVSAPGPVSGLRIQRKCACGGAGTCEKCNSAKQGSVPVGPVDDVFEREADRVADRIMRAPDPEAGASRSSVHIQRQATVNPGSDTTLTAASLSTGGSPLPGEVRQYFEPRFARNFSGVRVHTGAQADIANDGLGARAFTYGNHIWLGAGQNVGSNALLAHELTHVVQQTGPPESVSPRAIQTSPAPDSTASYLRNVKGGDPLPSESRRFFEQRFGLPLDHVRIHNDSRANTAAHDLGAKAFAVDNHIGFAAGRYDPETSSGRGLLAHEITHVLQQPGHVALQPVTKPDPSPAKPEPPHCGRINPPGSGTASRADKSQGPSGTYTIFGTPYNGESGADYAALAIRAWIPWRFGRVSSAVAKRIETELWRPTFRWTEGAPDKGCQGDVRFALERLDRISGLVSKDQAAQEAGKKETAAGLPTLRTPAPISDIGNPTGPTVSPTSTADKGTLVEAALDPTSVYEAGAKGDANYPPFPASMEGPDMEAPKGIGAYTMNLNWATNNPWMIVAYSMNAVYYTWELFNVTEVLRAGMGSGVLEEARRMKENSDAQSAADGALRQSISNDVDQLSEETARSIQGLRDPLKAAQGGSAVDVVTRAYANQLNLELLPVSAIVTAGGWLVKAFGTLFDKYQNEKEIAFPGNEGYYMVRCIAQPAPRGKDDSERRAASVRAKIVEVRSSEKLLENALYMSDAVLAELRARRAMTPDKDEIARIDAQIAGIEEQSGGIRFDKNGAVIEEKAAGDLVAYLSRLVSEKEAEREKLPEWQRDRADRELKALRLRLDQAKEKREGTVGVHHRPRVAFTSKITGDTYPLLMEVTQLEAETGARVRLMDLTVPDREPVDRSGPDLDGAMNNALNEFAMHASLGRGFLLVRLPPTWPGGARTLPLIPTGDADTAIARRRLADLATALMVLSLVVPGVGEVAMAIGAALATERLIRRGMNGTLRLDAESISDTLAILGAIAQGAQLIGQLRVVKAGDSFVAAVKTGDAAAAKSAAEMLDAARKGGKILQVTSAVVNAGGLIWGDLVSIDQMIQIDRDEVDGRITHAQARRQRAEMFTAAITTHGVMLAGALRPHGAGLAAGEENVPTETGQPWERRTADPETLPDSELERRATSGAAAQGQAEPTEPAADGVRARFRTPDGLHEIFILNDGAIFRCSLTCAQLRTWYDAYLNRQPEGSRRQQATELDNQLEALEKRTAAGENTPELQQAIARLDVVMREFIAPDLTRDLRQGAETRGLIKPGEAFLPEADVRRLLRSLNIDEINAVTGESGLNSIDTIREFAKLPEDFFVQAKKLGILDTIARGGPEGAEAADFLGRATRIHDVKGVTFESGKFDLNELHAAFLRGDAILVKGPLQEGIPVEEIVGDKVALSEGRLDLETKKGRMPKSLSSGVLDFVIFEVQGIPKLVLGRNHSGLSGGRAHVIAAGEIRFDSKGIITEINNQSGHYRPSRDNLFRAVKFMNDGGLLYPHPDRPVNVRVIE